MAFAVPVWLLVAWILTGTGTGRFLLLLLAMPVSFLLLAAAALLIRLRPDVREADGALPPGEALLLAGNWLLWGVAGPLGEGVQNLVTVLAIAASAATVFVLWRRMRRIAGERVRSAMGGRTPARGPGAGTVITVVDAASPTADGDAAGMPGSSRGSGGPARIDSQRPGVNFGANAAPVADDWDPERPVRGAE